LTGGSNPGPAGGRCGSIEGGIGRQSFSDGHSRGAPIGLVAVGEGIR
jgi:hypothetical protein